MRISGNEPARPFRGNVSGDCVSCRQIPACRMRRSHWRVRSCANPTGRADSVWPRKKQCDRTPRNSRLCKFSCRRSLNVELRCTHASTASSAGHASFQVCRIEFFSRPVPRRDPAAPRWEGLTTVKRFGGDRTAALAAEGREPFWQQLSGPSLRRASRR